MINCGEAMNFFGNQMKAKESFPRNIHIHTKFSIKVRASHIVCVLSHVRLFVASWTGAHQAPVSIGFSRQEYRSGLPFPPPGDLPDPGIEPTCLMSPSLADGLFTSGATWEALACELIEVHA